MFSHIEIARVILAIGVCIVLPSCARRSTESGTDATTGDEDTNVPQLALADVSLSFEITKRDSHGLPEAIRVHYKNQSMQRGSFELPGPVSGKPEGAYHVPAIAIGMQFGNEDDVALSGEPVFLYAPPEAEYASAPFVRTIPPGAATTADYSLDRFCMIGHGIEPDPDCNIRTCYRPGDVKTEMRVYVISDWTGFKKINSPSTTIKLSEADFSKHREVREAIERPKD